jgi:hypothetical protein
MYLFRFLLRLLPLETLSPLRISEDTPIIFMLRYKLCFKLPIWQEMLIVNKVINSTLYVNIIPQFHFEFSEFLSTSGSYKFSVGSNLRGY